MKDEGIRIKLTAGGNAQEVVERTVKSVEKLTIKIKLVSNQIVKTTQAVGRSVAGMKHAGHEMDKTGKKMRKMGGNANFATQRINVLVRTIGLISAAKSPGRILAVLTLAVGSFGSALLALAIPVGALAMMFVQLRKFADIGAMVTKTIDDINERVEAGAVVNDPAERLARMEKVLPYFKEFQETWQAITHIGELFAEFIVDIQGGIENATRNAKAFREAMATVISKVVYFLSILLQLFVNFSNGVVDLINNGGIPLENVLIKILAISSGIGVAWGIITGSIGMAVIGAVTLLAIIAKLALNEYDKKRGLELDKELEEDGSYEAWLKKEVEMRKQNRDHAGNLDPLYAMRQLVDGPKSDAQLRAEAIERFNDYNTHRGSDTPVKDMLSDAWNGLGEGITGLLGDNPFGINFDQSKMFADSIKDMLTNWKFEDPLEKAIKENTKALNYTTGALADFHGFVDIARRNLSVHGGSNVERMYGNLDDMNLNKYAYDPSTGSVYSQATQRSDYSPISHPSSESKGSGNPVMNLSVTQNISGTSSSSTGGTDDLADKVVTGLVRAFDEAGGFKVTSASKHGISKPVGGGV
jgi:hypothetical protein